MSSGFIIANFGRMASPPAPRLSIPFSSVMTHLSEPSLPAAAIVGITPKGRASVNFALPVKKISEVSVVRDSHGDCLR